MSSKKKKRPDFRKTKNYLDQKDYNQILEDAPGIIEDIEDALEYGYTSTEIGRIVRDHSRHKWIESKIIEAAARYIIAQRG